MIEKLFFFHCKWHIYMYKPNNSIATRVRLTDISSWPVDFETHNFNKHIVCIVQFRNQWWAPQQLDSFPLSMVSRRVSQWWTWRSCSRWCCMLHLKRTTWHSGPLHMFLPVQHINVKYLILMTWKSAILEYVPNSNMSCLTSLIWYEEMTETRILDTT